MPMPIYGDGGSPVVLNALASAVDVYMLWEEPLQATATFVKEACVVARQTIRCPTFSALVHTERA